MPEWKTFGPPLCPAQKPEVNSWFKANHLHTAGLSGNNNVMPLFATSECVRLWKELNDLDRGVVIEGAPGVGKSISVWTWACHQAMHCKKSILWVHVDSAMFSSCALLSAIDCRRSNIRDPKELSELMTLSDADIVIFDGYKSNLDFLVCIRSLFPLPLSEKRKGIAVSSLAGGLQPEHFGQISRKISFFTFAPWSLQSYLEACANDEFFASVQDKFEPYDGDIGPFAPAALAGFLPDAISEHAIRKARVEEKYYYAGASARWMFAYTTSKIKVAVERHMDKVSNFKVLLDEAQGYQAKESSNHLLMRTKESGKTETFFVSRYVLKRLLHESRDRGDIQRAYELAKRHNNPSFLGWVVEFDFVEQLYESSVHSPKIMNLYDKLDGDVLWTVSSLTSFDAKSPFENSWLLDQYKIPTLWNQGGYDAVGFVRSGGKRILRFIQVTRGKTHQLKLKYFSELAAAFLKAKLADPSYFGVEIAIVLPRFQGSQFTVETVIEVVNSGQLSHYNVGGSSAKWIYRNEKSQLRFVYFDADGPSRRGRGFLRWLASRVPK